MWPTDKMESVVDTPGAKLPTYLRSRTISNAAVQSNTVHTGSKHYMQEANITFRKQTLHSGSKHYMQEENITFRKQTLHSGSKHYMQEANITCRKQTLHTGSKNDSFLYVPMLYASGIPMSFPYFICAV